AGVDDGAHRTGAAISLHHGEGVSLGYVLRLVTGSGQRTDVAQRHRNRLRARHHGQALCRGGEAELEGQVLHPVTVVVDGDFVERVRVHGEVVRTGLRLLQALVIRDEGDETRAAGFIA